MITLFFFRTALFLMKIAFILSLSPEFENFYFEGVKHLRNNDYANAISFLKNALIVEPMDVEVNQLLGSLYCVVKDYSNCVERLEVAIQLDKAQTSRIVANYVEALRLNGNVSLSIMEGVKGIAMYPKDANLAHNLGNSYSIIGDMSNAEALFRRSVQLDPSALEVWKKLFDILILRNAFDEAESLVQTAMTNFPSNTPDLIFYSGIIKHNQNKLSEALELYKLVMLLDPSNQLIFANVAAIYQSLGMVEEALKYYELVLRYMPKDAGVLNNYGSLLGMMNRKEEELHWLLKSYALDPTIIHTNLNLAAYYQDEGDLLLTREYLYHAKKLTNNSILIDLRLSTLVSPVCTSWRQMLQERNEVEREVKLLLNRVNACLQASNDPTIIAPATNSSCDVAPLPLNDALGRIHFYIVYHGVNDRYLQELIVEVYRRVVLDLSYYNPNIINPSLDVYQQAIVDKVKIHAMTVNKPAIKPGVMQLQSKPLALSTLAPAAAGGGRVRVGFMSKYFGLFEPHGLLLDGVMKYLPASVFEVILLEVARTDGKPLSSVLASVVSKIVYIPLNREAAAEVINSQGLDILIFADVLSEPMNHFLAHSRFAPIQIAFWGNPVTSASHAIDYFISADMMEHPFRTRMPIQDEPYTEQVILLAGQGIWYFTPTSAKEEVSRANFSIPGWEVSEAEYSRKDFGFQEDWFIFFCPQSVFKMHPLFDEVIRDVLMGDERAHVVLTGGRKQAWTDKYASRLQNTLPSSVMSRLHIIPRVSSERFLQLLRIADVMLHPFPFDGSRTSADNLIQHIPLVTLPTEYLRGRMGAAFLRTMNLPELVARNRSDYVSICMKLLQDRVFYRDIKSRIVSHVSLIWEDMEYIHSWTSLLLQISGFAPWTWEAFIQSTGREVVVETQKRDRIRSHHRLFQQHYGTEDWLLEGGMARLETKLTDTAIPRIFNDWKRDVRAMSYAAQDSYLQHVYTHQMRSLWYLTNTTVTAVGNTRMKSRRSVDNSVSLPDAYTSPIPNATYTVIKSLILSGKISQGYDFLYSYYQTHSKHPHYLMDLGLLEYFRGNYELSYQYCNQSLYELRQLYHQSKHHHERIADYHESGILYSCFGLNGMYLKQGNNLQDVLHAYEYSLKFDHDILYSEIFVLPTSAMDRNLITAYQSSNNSRQCWKMASLSLSRKRFDGSIHSGAPPVVKNEDEFNAYVIIFSFIDWSSSSILTKDRYELFTALERQLFVNYEEGHKYRFIEEIIRFQTYYSHILDPGLDCLRAANKVLVSQVMYQLTNILHQLPPTYSVHSQEQSRSHKLGSIQSESRNCDANAIALVVQYYIPNDPAIGHSINTTLLKNLYNPCIKDIYLLTESYIEMHMFASAVTSVKLHQHVISKRMTYYDAVHFSNQYLAGRIVIIANADIYFDETLQRLPLPYPLDRQRVNNTRSWDNTVLALTKWIDKGNREHVQLYLRSDSQDAWIFQSPLIYTPSLEDTSEETEARLLDIEIGTARCDNRVVYILSQDIHYQSHGYHVMNTPFMIHAIEYDQRPRQSGLYSTSGATIGDGQSVLFSDRVYTLF